MDYTIIIASVVVFLSIIFVLVGMLLGAKAKLMPSGPVSLLINGENDVEVSSGSTLLNTLGNNKIFLPSACGGGGTCIQCKCQVLEGGGEILPTEKPHFSRKEIAEGWRLGCQVKVKENMVIQVPEEVFGIKKWKQLLCVTGTWLLLSKNLSWNYQKKWITKRVDTSKLKFQNVR